MGMIYWRKKKLWGKYYIDGQSKPVRESTGTDQEKEARRFLKEREGRAAAGQPALPRADRVRYKEARADLTAHYQTTGSRTLPEAATRLRHLDRFFGDRRLVNITGAVITEYVGQRQAEGAAN